MLSMTGFGHGRFALDASSFRVEARSVNHRFLDINLRLPWTDAALEGRVLAAVRGRMARGRVDLVVVEDQAGTGETLHLNTALARSLAGVLGDLSSVLGVDPAAAVPLLGQPRGLLSACGACRGTEETWAAVGPAVGAALDELIEGRRREGDAHRRSFEQHDAALASAAAEIRRLASAEPDRLRATLVQRLDRLRSEGIELDPARVAQEAALAADRCDITEELDRLASHRAQLGLLLASDERAMGRKIEFLLQEIHRELSTMGAKTQSAEVSHLVVDAKAAVEKMRELAQNIE